MTYIIHGASGAQGAPLLKRLLAAGETALAAGRSSGEGAIRADYNSVESLVSAYGGAKGVFVHLPQTVEPERVQYARNIVEAIRQAKSTRVVVSTSGMIVDQPGTLLQASDDSAIAILIDGLKETGVSYAVVAPRLYLENLLLPMVIGNVEAEGVLRYPVRADFPVSWSSHLDVAEVSERLLGAAEITGVVGVGHLPGLLGADLAKGFESHFGRSVEFESLSPEAFGKLIEPMFGPATAGVVGLYQALSQVPDNVIAEETSAQRLLGLTPRSVQQWLGEVLAR